MWVALNESEGTQVSNLIHPMKMNSFFLVPAACLVFSLSTARAEEPAPVQASPEMQALLADLLKKASNTSTLTTDGQTQELQTLLVGVLKVLSQMLPQIIAALDSTPSPASAPSELNIADFLDASDTPPAKMVEKGLRTSGLTTGGLNPGGSSNMSDDEWRRIFQRRAARH